MLLSELIEHMQTLMAEHGDHDVWIYIEGEPAPYLPGYFEFIPDGLDGSSRLPKSCYTV